MQIIQIGKIAAASSKKRQHCLLLELKQFQSFVLNFSIFEIGWGRGYGGKEERRKEKRLSNLYNNFSFLVWFLYFCKKNVILGARLVAACDFEGEYKQIYVEGCFLQKLSYFIQSTDKQFTHSFIQIA